MNDDTELMNAMLEYIAKMPPEVRDVLKTVYEDGLSIKFYTDDFKTEIRAREDFQMGDIPPVLREAWLELKAQTGPRRSQVLAIVDGFAAKLELYTYPRYKSSKERSW